MEVKLLRIEDITPYENNPRQNDEAVEPVMHSIREFGFKVPVVVDRDRIIVAGHTRYKAAVKMGLKEIPCIVAEDLDDEKVRAFRLADNKTAELSRWDEDLLQKELAQILDIDMGKFGFEDEGDQVDDTYTTAVNVPQYDVQGDNPSFADMLDTSKSDELIAEIQQSGVSEAEKEFLMQAAGRHNVFNYRHIAEYYAHASPEMQTLMEKSALVIIDYDNAIANGYAVLFGEVLEAMGMEDTGDA